MIYQITEAQRQQLLEFARQATYLTAPFDVSKAAHEMLQSLAPVDAEAVGYINEMDEPVLFNDKPGRPDKRRKEAAVCVGSGWQYLYTHPAPLRELSDDEIDAAWRSVDYTQPYDAFRIAVARAILKKAGEK